MACGDILMRIGSLRHSVYPDQAPYRAALEGGRSLSTIDRKPMFVTNPSFEQAMPRGLAAPACRYWTGFGLTSPTAWFLVSYRTTVPDGTILQTVGVAWELRLVELITTVGHDAVLSLQHVAPERPFDGSWRMARISELWKPSDAEAPRTGPLLLRVRGESYLRDPFAEEVADTGEGRQLLLRLPDWTL